MNTCRMSAGCASLLALTMTLGGCRQSAPSDSEVTSLLAPSAALTAKTEHAIKIVSGELVYDASVSPFTTLNLKGTAGFRLETGNAYGSGYPPTGCAVASPCLPGTIALNGLPNSYSDLIGAVTIRGQTYQLSVVDASVVFAFSGEVTLPPFAGDEIIELSTPVTITGTVRYYPDGPLAPNEVVSNFSGGGVARLRFEAWHLDSTTHVWTIANALYEF